jgi:splicing factor 3B subunit 3
MVMVFVITGANRDYLVVGSDSGKITILEYHADSNSFVRVHSEIFGRSGCRRIVPGQYLATDPKGRAVMIGAVEKQKFVYILNRDSSAKLTISSPLEAHKSHTILFDTVGLDVGFDNPIFACLEIDYQKADQDPTGEAAATAQKQLTLYELDLGLNHVTRKWSDTVDRTANKLVAIPGGSDGPGGVLVCSQDWVTWRHPNQPARRVRLPRRLDVTFNDNDGLLIVASAVHKMRDSFLVLLQSEHGDLYKVHLEYEGEAVHNIRISYFDTIPVASSLAVLRTGFIFAASEVGNHGVYRFIDVGDPDAPEETFAQPGDEINRYIRPRKLAHLEAADDLPSLSPIWDVKVDNILKEETPQIYAFTGSGARSSLRILRQGIAVTTMISADLPGNPLAVWSIKREAADAYDKYIVVSFANNTIVLEVGESVEEVTDSGFLLNTPTLHAALVGTDQMIQVYPGGFRRIRSDGRPQEWKPPAGRTIVAAASNERQIAIAVTGGEIFYFEADNPADIDKINTGKEVVALALQSTPKDRLRARFLAAADADNKVRIYSVEGSDMLQVLSTQLLPARASSLSMITLTAYGSTQLYLCSGTVNGILLRSSIDEQSGQLSDARKKFLGSKPVRMARVMVQGSPALVCLSSRAWLAYGHQQAFRVNPLSYAALDWASSFSSEMCPEGIVALAKGALRFLVPERLGDMFNQTVIPLRYTPRQSAIHPISKYIITIETDHNAYPEQMKKQVQQENGTGGGGDSSVKIKTENDMDIDEGAIEQDEQQDAASSTAMPEALYGVPRPGSGVWASCVRVLDVTQSKTLDLLELEENEAAVSLCTCTFRDHSGEVFVVVGTAKNMVIQPRRDTKDGGYIHIYRLEGGSKLQLLHKKQVEDVPTAIVGYQGRLLVGLGRTLRIYDLGKRKMQLLRKCENSNFPNTIVTLSTHGERIVVGDVQESVLIVKYNRPDNSLYILADDMVPRWITSHTILDYNTVAGSDKFGNVFIVRLPDKASQLDEDPTGNRAVWDQGNLNGAPFKVEPVCNYYVGETVTRVVKSALSPGGAEALIYTTTFGTIGCLVPFASREDVDLFSHLEMHMRSYNPPLCGRDHLAFRSFYFPVKNVIDGDLCEQYSQLSTDKQRQIAASELERSVADVQRKIEDIRESI